MSSSLSLITSFKSQIQSLYLPNIAAPALEAAAEEKTVLEGSGTNDSV